MKRITVLGILVAFVTANTVILRGQERPAHKPDIKALPLIQHVRSKQITIEYQVARVGPSGITIPDLWWTRDGGRTWAKAPTPPHQDEVNKNGRYQRTVELQEDDGVYGLTVVARSGVGRGKQPPKSGDIPQVRVELDTVAPQVSLLWCMFAKPDTLRVAWKAQDKNLAPQPVTLEWSDKIEGPWQRIAADLPNSGMHSWKLPPDIPVKIYLRVRARDLAGNEGIAVTQEAQITDMSEPEAQIVTIGQSPR